MIVIAGGFITEILVVRLLETSCDNFIQKEDLQKKKTDENLKRLNHNLRTVDGAAANEMKYKLLS